MPTFTPDMAGDTIIVTLIGLGLALIFNAVMLYLNWKQSKVKNQMGELIEEVREIKDLIKNKQK